jgi:hypothetical protein
MEEVLASTSSSINDQGRRVTTQTIVTKRRGSALFVGKPIAAAAAAISIPAAVAAIPSVFQAPPQEKAKPARAGNKLDDSLLTSKKPSADIDKAQRIGTPGETIPIVFGKRANSIGGVWIQPPLVKAGTKLFVGSFLYPVSQGEIVSTPVKYRAWVGTRNIAFLADQTITLQHDYATAASLAAAPSVCPIGGSTLFCGVETFSYLRPVTKAEVGFVDTDTVNYDAYFGARQITRGTGNTSNTVFIFTAADVQVFNSDTGADITATWLAYTGYSPSLQFLNNYNSTTGGGRTVGTIFDAVALFGYFPPDPVTAAALGIPSGAKAIFQYTISIVDTQYNASLPASTGTLIGCKTRLLKPHTPTQHQHQLLTTQHMQTSPSCALTATSTIHRVRVHSQLPPSRSSSTTSKASRLTCTAAGWWAASIPVVLAISWWIW